MTLVMLGHGLLFVALAALVHACLFAEIRR